MSMLNMPANVRVPYPEMADHGRHGIPDNLAYIDQADFDDLEEFDTTSDKGYDSCKGTPRRTPKKVRVQSIEAFCVATQFHSLYFAWYCCWKSVCLLEGHWQSLADILPVGPSRRDV